MNIVTNQIAIYYTNFCFKNMSKVVMHSCTSILWISYDLKIADVTRHLMMSYDFSTNAYRTLYTNAQMNNNVLL